MLAAIGLGTAAGFALFGTIAILIGAAVMAFVVIRRRRRAQACSSNESSVPVSVGLTTTRLTTMSLADLTRVRWLIGALLIAAAALFAIGVATEGGHHAENVASVESGEHNEATEHSEATEHNEQTEASESGETVFGINLESTPLVALAVVVSVVLAVATWRTDYKVVLLVTALFAAAFAVLDVAEFSHQIKESATTIAVIAAIIAVLHAAAALLAEQRRAAAP